jgi:hypothetical protein
MTADSKQEKNISKVKKNESKLISFFISCYMFI